MSPHVRNHLLLPVFSASLGLALVGQAAAQSFTNLHNFAGFPGDGASPYGGLTVAGGELFGTTFEGGSSDFGSVFKMNVDGTGYTNLHSFVGSPSDGVHPPAGLALSGAVLYGTAEYGGASEKGMLFGISLDGGVYTNLHSFTLAGGDGGFPLAGLTILGNTLYGTTLYGSQGSAGMVFGITTNGTFFTNLHSFAASGSAGTDPYARLILSGTTLYGAMEYGGSSGHGTLFSVNLDGTGFTNFYNFTNGNDGASPSAGLLLLGDTLYGTASEGGVSGNGTVFAIGTNGMGFTNLYSFTATDPITGENTDGAGPESELILVGNTLFGTASGGGSSGNGTVFAIGTNGAGFTNLYSFTATDSATGDNSDGATPLAGLVLSGNTLYGTTSVGGASGNGTVFGLLLTLAPQLTIVNSAGNIVLSWPTNFPGCVLQTTADLSSPAGWSNASPGPVVVSGQNTVTNPTSGAQGFFRLVW